MDCRPSPILQEIEEVEECCQQHPEDTDNLVQDVGNTPGQIVDFLHR